MAKNKHIDEVVSLDDPADIFVEVALANPSKESLALARKVDGTLTYFTSEEDKILRTLVSLNIVVSHEDGWLRGVNWREYMRKT